MTRPKDVKESFSAVKDAFKMKIGAARARVKAAEEQYSKYHVFQSLMETAEAGRLRMPEKSYPRECDDCGSETVVVERSEDRSVMFGDGPSYPYAYVVCFSCCTAHEPGGSMTDAIGRRFLV